MTRPESTPPPRPRWVWAVIIVVALGLVAMLITHLFMGNPMQKMHGSAAAVVSPAEPLPWPVSWPVS